MNFNHDVNKNWQGKANFSSEAEFIAAIKVLTKRGYGFTTPGRALDEPIPESDFYGIKWEYSSEMRGFIWHYTTQIDVYAAY